MFCPKCGIGNSVDQKFCRGCGHALAGHRAALEDNFAENVEKIRSGATSLGASAVGMIMISLMALGVWITQKDAGAFYTLVPVIAFMIPATIVGLVRLNRAYRALSARHRREVKAVEQSKTKAILRTSAPDTDPLAQGRRFPGSVAERTTLSLETPGAASDESAQRPQVDSPSSAT